tara:strand:+ start:236 stop:379 length:144 start_codon:yes stop_codon:yes gene_type:complete
VRIDMKKKKKLQGIIIKPEMSYAEVKKSLIEALKKQGIKVTKNRHQE